MKHSSEKRWQFWPAPTPTSSIFVEKFWRELPPGDMLSFLLGVFFTFSIIGYLVVLWDGQWYSWTNVLVSVVLVGVVAAGYAYTSLTRRFKWLVLFVALHTGLVFIQSFFQQEGKPIQSSQLTIIGMLILIHIVLGYVLFAIFISRVGDRIGRIRQELELGQKMHTALVPPLRGKYGYVEVYGRSLPMQEIGGDLMDVVATPGRVTAYVADVSGHGVSAGLLMSATKSAIRTALHHNHSLEALLREVNPVILGMKERTMFVTFAGVHFDANRHLAEIVTAGHPPVLYYERKTRTVHTLQVSQLPLGARRGQPFQTRVVHYALGDIFLLFTDGILETYRTSFELLDTERLAATLREHSAEGLDTIYAALRQTIDATVKPIDDQTILLLRCLG